MKASELIGKLAIRTKPLRILKAGRLDGLPFVGNVLAEDGEGRIWMERESDDWQEYKPTTVECYCDGFWYRVRAKQEPICGNPSHAWRWIDWNGGAQGCIACFDSSFSIQDKKPIADQDGLYFNM